MSRQLHDARANQEENGIEPILSRDNWMILAEMRPSDDEFDEIEGVEVDRSFDWIQNANQYASTIIHKMRGWIECQKLILNDSNASEQTNIVNFSQLNSMQKFAFNLVKNFKESNKQLLLIINGTAGTGKSFTIQAISNLIGPKLSRCAPTAKAAFIIKGETLHSTFSIPVIKKEKDIIVDLSGEKLSNIQEKFKEITHVIIFYVVASFNGPN